ncbi:hypothetical protein [Raineyella fluvialis]|uniref:DUF3592 domain-containing protein n=1 Tax=Raineyella fluvialis TaxID=2662261 RepID=A0A5Q2F9M3_9ACTN|nr:hypothetical protein [Raineyella fluvialis]QGF23602.1 hypothetical protein Rai3103_07905 [Raineyella fluvialis]
MRILRAVGVIILLTLGVAAFVAAGVQIKAGEVGEWGTFTVTTVNCSTKVCTVSGDFRGVKYVKTRIILGNEAGEDVGDEVAAWYSPNEGRDGVAYRAPWRWWIAPFVTILFGLAVLVLAFDSAMTRLRFGAPAQAPARALPNPSEDD